MLRRVCTHTLSRAPGRSRKLAMNNMQQSRSGPLLSVCSGVQSSPKWSMKGKAQNSMKNSTPGPGAYSGADASPNKFGRSPNYGFGGSPREIPRPQTAPGPGQYQPVDPKEDLSAKYGFGTSDRVGIRNRHELPGPASYVIPGKMGYEGPKYSSVGRRLNLGAYQTPGPGAYQPEEMGTSAYKRTQKWGFGTSPRDGRGMASSPGPGSYERDSYMRTGPKFSMKPRNETMTKDMTPGPGEYGGVYTCFG